jgi:adenine/guanine phosphoribosyltransferase-like PRPP-binding protein
MLLAGDTLDFMKFSYMETAFDPASLVERAEANLKGAEIEFDCFVGIGLSGYLALPILSLHFNVPYLALRKEEDGSHSHQIAEGKLGRKYVLVDDFVQTGKTISNAIARLRDLSSRTTFDAECVGVFLYESGFNGEMYNYHEGTREGFTRLKFNDEFYYFPSLMVVALKNSIEDFVDAGSPLPVAAAMQRTGTRYESLWDWDEMSLCASIIYDNMNS